MAFRFTHLGTVARVQVNALVPKIVEHGYNVEAHPMEAEAHRYGLAFGSSFEAWARSMRGGA